MPPLTFDFGQLAVDSTVTFNTPLLHSFTDASSGNSNVVVDLNWYKSQGDWSNLFTYKTTTDDLDLSFNLMDISSTDILYGTNKARWYNSNFIKDPSSVLSSGMLSSGTAIEGENSIGRELLFNIANDIFGTFGSVDMFSNESAMLTDITRDSSGGCYHKLNENIQTKLDDSNELGGAGSRSSKNFAHQALTQILNHQPGGDASASRSTKALDAFDASGGTNASEVVNNVPLEPDDIIVFTVEVHPTFNADDTGATSNNHSIGMNPVNSRKYKIRLTLKN